MLCEQQKQSIVLRLDLFTLHRADRKWQTKLSSAPCRSQSETQSDSHWSRIPGAPGSDAPVKTKPIQSEERNPRRAAEERDGNVAPLLSGRHRPSTKPPAFFCFAPPVFLFVSVALFFLLISDSERRWHIKHLLGIEDGRTGVFATQGRLSPEIRNYKRTNVGIDFCRRCCWASVCVVRQLLHFALSSRHWFFGFCYCQLTIGGWISGRKQGTTQGHVLLYLLFPPTFNQSNFLHRLVFILIFLLSFKFLMRLCDGSVWSANLVRQTSVLVRRCERTLPSEGAFPSQTNTQNPRKPH